MAADAAAELAEASAFEVSTRPFPGSGLLAAAGCCATVEAAAASAGGAVAAAAEMLEAVSEPAGAAVFACVPTGALRSVVFGTTGAVAATAVAKVPSVDRVAPVAIAGCFPGTAATAVAAVAIFAFAAVAVAAAAVVAVAVPVAAAAAPGSTGVCAAGAAAAVVAGELAAIAAAAIASGAVALPDGGVAGATFAGAVATGMTTATAFGVTGAPTCCAKVAGLAAEPVSEDDLVLDFVVLVFESADFALDPWPALVSALAATGALALLLLALGACPGLAPGLSEAVPADGLAAAVSDERVLSVPDGAASERLGETDWVGAIELALALLLLSADALLSTSAPKLLGPDDGSDRAGLCGALW